MTREPGDAEVDSGRPDFIGPALWHPPLGVPPTPPQVDQPQQWAPPQGHLRTDVPAARSRAGARSLLGSSSDRRRAWLVLSCVVALTGIYLSVMTLYLRSHVVDRYEQAAPGASITAVHIDYTLLSLTRVSALPSGSVGDKNPAKSGEAFVLATLRVTPHSQDSLASACSGVLVGAGKRTWDPTYYSSHADNVDADYCSDITVDQTVQVTLGYALPQEYLDQVMGIGVQRYNGSPIPVLTPPKK